MQRQFPDQAVHRSVVILMMLTGIIVLPACSREPPRVAVTVASARDIPLPADTTVIEDRVPVHATLDGLLRGHRIDEDAARLVVAAARTAFNPRALRTGQPYKLVTSLGGRFRSFEYRIADDRLLRVVGPEDSPEAAGADLPGPQLEDLDDLRAEIVTSPSHRETLTASGLVDRQHPSLIAAVNAAGEGADLALRLAEIFAGQLDFNAELQPNDRFEALFERDFREDRPAGYGAILAAAIVHNGRRIQAFRFVDEQGQAGYYDENGRSVRRSFLRSPLPFNPRVTSGFSLRRLHPVDGIARAHLGVDYAAPTGTAVLAVADGVVVSAGFSGASGRMIRLRHANGYQTYYLHLSAIGREVRAGARVSQGDVIGRVGASGVVTGPHLDFRMATRRGFVNPLTEPRTLPPGDSIAGRSRAAFDAMRDGASARMAGNPSDRSATLVAGGERVRPGAGMITDN